MFNNLIFFLTFTWSIIKASTKSSLVEMLWKRVKNINPAIEIVVPAPSRNNVDNEAHYIDEIKHINNTKRKVRDETFENDKYYIHLN